MISVNHTVEMSQSVMQSNVIYVQENIKPAEEHRDSNEFLFQGEEATFIETVQAMSQQAIQSAVSCNIYIIGWQVKPDSPKCFIFTILMGLCLIFPFFFFCCQWWKRAVSQVFQIKEETYVSLAKIIRGKKMQTVTITIFDNYLTKSKIKLLLRAMTKNRIHKLTFVNEAGAFDMDEEQYSNFLKNIKPFMNLRLKKWYISWYKQLLQSEEIIV